MDQPVALRPREVPLQWHEAAAIVQLVADYVSDRRLTDVPRVEWLALDDDGAVHVLEPPSRSALVPRDEPEAAELRSLFQELVGSNPVPAALLPALSSARDGTPIDSAAAFNEAIRFFVRPSSEKDLQAVAARLRVHEEASRLQNELEELTRKARLPHEKAKDEQPSEPSTPTPHAGSRLKKLVAIAACGALLPIVLVLRGSSGSDPDGSVGATLVSQGKQLVKDVRDGARTLLGTAPEADEQPVATASSANSPRISGRRVSGRAPRASLDAPVRQTPAASLAWILSEPIEPAPALIEVEVAPLVASGDAERLYDSDDGEVSPANLVRPRLPARQPGTKPLGALEVIVAASGHVERVRLLATTAEHRYYDAMLLPAVKAWVFSPARRDGVPVRYRLEIPLTH